MLPNLQHLSSYLRTDEEGGGSAAIDRMAVDTYSRQPVFTAGTGTRR
jgi:hypothetical protein